MKQQVECRRALTLPDGVEHLASISALAPVARNERAPGFLDITKKTSAAQKLVATSNSQDGEVACLVIDKGH